MASQAVAATFFICRNHSNNTNLVQPFEERRMGLYVKGNWYHLKAKPNTYTYCAKCNVLDVSILQDYILSRLFHINDPATDQRLKHVGGDKAMRRKWRRCLWKTPMPLALHFVR